MKNRRTAFSLVSCMVLVAATLAPGAASALLVGSVVNTVTNTAKQVANDAAKVVDPAAAQAQAAVNSAVQTVTNAVQPLPGLVVGAATRAGALVTALGDTWVANQRAQAKSLWATTLTGLQDTAATMQRTFWTYATMFPAGCGRGHR